MDWLSTRYERTRSSVASADDAADDDDCDNDHDVNDNFIFDYVYVIILIFKCCYFFVKLSLCCSLLRCCPTARWNVEELCVSGIFKRYQHILCWTEYGGLGRPVSLQQIPNLCCWWSTSGVTARYSATWIYFVFFEVQICLEQQQNSF